MAEFVALAERVAVLCAVAVAAVVDLRTRTIPDVCSVVIVVVRCAAIAALSLVGEDAAKLMCAALVGTLTAGLPLVLAALVSDGVGGGDVKLFSALGFALGWQRALALVFLSCAFTVAAGLACFLVRRSGNIQTRLMSTTVPMAPLIALSLVAVYWLLQI